MLLRTMDCTKKMLVVANIIAWGSICLFLLLHAWIIQPQEPETIHTKMNVTFLAEEVKFPLAFSLIVYRDMDQVERLLRAIYRPFNFYCIHIDLKSSSSDHTFVKNITLTYDNVIIPRKFVKVIWATFTALEAELLCMEALLNHSKKWKYLINLSGQEWPLKTNLELVRIFKVLNGANLVEKAKHIPNRIRNQKTKVPHNIHIWQGQVHVMVTREFVNFLFHDYRIPDFLKYLKHNVKQPDDIFFSAVSSSHNLQAPGGYAGKLERDQVHYPSVQRYKLWKGHSTCHGRWFRWVCIFAMPDIPAITKNSNHKLFVNKFMKNVNDDVLNFMEGWFHDRSKLVYSHPETNPLIDLEYYRRLPQVNDHW